MLKNALAGLVVLVVLVAMAVFAPLTAVAQDPAVPRQKREQTVIPLPNNATLDGLTKTMKGVHGKYKEVTVELNSEGWVDFAGPKSDVEEAIRMFTRYFDDRRQADEEALKELDDSTVTLNFPGGTVGEFVDAVLKKFDVVPPIYESEELRSLQMRPVDIRLMQVNSALGLLEVMPPTNARGEAVPLAATFVGTPVPLTGLSASQSQRLMLQQRLCIIKPKYVPGSRMIPTRRTAFALTDGVPLPKDELDAILDAISLAVNLDGQSTTFLAKYHAPSGLFIVRGTPDELGVVAQIIKSKLPNARVQLPEMTSDATPAPENASTDATPTTPASANPSASQRNPKR